ncbi:hypothetical protein ACIBU0_30970 [Streptomyces sp. NPDC049627]|uniref:hypothetical protein n=1 Tax=Streptomyces sp. NPDC049627 TaxID=3365595 RepID=UPI00379FC054
MVDQEQAVRVGAAAANGFDAAGCGGEDGTDAGLVADTVQQCGRRVEFDVAHAPEEVGERYPGADQDLLGVCRILVPAMITTWRWDRGDQLPDGRRWGVEWLSQIRAALDRNGLDSRG